LRLGIDNAEKWVRLFLSLKPLPAVQEIEVSSISVNKFLFVLSLLVPLALILTTCGSPAPPLTGTTWQLTSYGSLSTQKPVVAEEGFITFGKDGKFTGIGACNRFEGDYEVKNNQIILSSIVWDVGGNVFCPEPQMSQESGVYEVLKGTVGFKVEGKTLTITSPLSETDGLVLVFEAVANNAGN
jgi:heat shock protein HslJ